MYLAGKRIFVVEDNALNRVVFTMTLKIHGAQVEFDRWGDSTLMRMKVFDRVDLIILDLMLQGGISGYDVFQEIRSTPEYAAVPIIAVSAADPSVALPKTQQLGFNGFIAKPLDDELFPKQVARILSGERVWFAGTQYQNSEV